MPALDAGARGYLLKDAEPTSCCAASGAAARGESPLDPRAAHAVLTRATVGADSLTAREREVLKPVADGLPNKQIARALGITGEDREGAHDQDLRRDRRDRPHRGRPLGPPQRRP